MSIDRHKLRWNGWGWVEAPDVLGEKAAGAFAWIGRTLGLDPLPHTPALPLEAVALPPSRLGPDQRETLAGMLAPDRVCAGDYERAFHALGKSYHDLLRLRAGAIDAPPDAVVYPETTDECLAVVRHCVDNNFALIPYGGGSSVVGGVNADAAPADCPAVITLDLTRMNKLLEIDAESLVARAQAGVYGPKLEEMLQAEGYTLGHYPQSFEFSTLGGWVAHRGAGQFSGRYGKAEHWFAGAEIATPAGLWRTEAFPASAAGPQMRDLAPGSEGLFGVITEAHFRVRPKPEAQDFRGYLFTDFAAAVAAARAMAQARLDAAMIRLSDRDETRFHTALKMGGEEPDPSLGFCAMLIGLEGEAARVEAARAATGAIIEEHGGMHFGESLGEAWYESRFATPYLRDPMLDRGLGVDTLETCTRWSNLKTLHAAVTEAIQQAMAAHPGVPGGKGICMAHLSHAYPDGASLYFTFAFPRDPGEPIAQWRAIKTAASDAILANGGTISHHHGVGTDHLPWVAQEKGAHSLNALRAIKRQIDPTHTLNPGKLIP